MLVVVLSALTLLVLGFANPEAELSFPAFIVGLYVVAVCMTVVAVWQTIQPPRHRALALRIAGLTALLLVALIPVSQGEGMLMQGARNSLAGVIQLPPDRAPEAGRIDQNQAPSFEYALLAALIVALLVAAFFAVRRLRRAELRAAPHDPDDEATAPWARRQALRAALDALHTDAGDGGERRRAVIAAYVALEASLEVAGHPRPPSDTAGEFVTRTLAAGYPLDRAEVEGLLAVFNRARFSSVDVSDEDVRTARAHLETLGVH